MPNALITGSGARASDVAAALRYGGFEPVCADSASDLVHLCASVPPKSLDCYVQLPDRGYSGGHPRAPGYSGGHPRAPWDPARTTALAEASAMVARYDAVTSVAPLLTETATVVLVMGGPVADERRSDLDGAVDDLTRVLARALRHDYRATAVKVALVEDRRSPSEIAAIARHGNDRPRPVPSYLDFEPDLGFADWRLEVLSLLPMGGALEN
jgi:hypothetical protein